MTALRYLPRLVQQKEVSKIYTGGSAPSNALGWGHHTGGSAPGLAPGLPEFGLRPSGHPGNPHLHLFGPEAIIFFNRANRAQAHHMDKQITLVLPDQVYLQSDLTLPGQATCGGPFFIVGKACLSMGRDESPLKLHVLFSTGPASPVHCLKKRTKARCAEAHA